MSDIKYLRELGFIKQDELNNVDTSSNRCQKT